MFQFFSKQKQSQILALMLVVAVPLYLSFNFTQPKLKTITSSGSEEETPMAANEFGVKVEKNPTQSKLIELGRYIVLSLKLSTIGLLCPLIVNSFNRWSCGPNKFPWSFSATETTYLLEGKVNVEVYGKEGSFTIGAGDFVVFPKGMKVTWDVIEAVNKHYSLAE
ncbi:hypothetical protein D8674_028642 [Pyrus ussuriensis x Pyrus communis]|uniref:(S)-ureidoglycine aminohydrolase cupin domain-containing protein n=1 Tax=Pyrus ussuriensis x Pyrus communis TaxID=2448454 RepID=A0A5N5HWV3_9ROSA|nr:hypothetical protein D8674_028642 [Pyrus ussuriensis x Pyrus communis]